MRIVALTLLVSVFTSAANGEDAQDDTSKSDPLVLLHVLNEDTGEPIERFHVLPGTPYSGTRDDAIAVWQPHLIREATAGRFEWPRERTYSEFRLRVEAEGYQPASTKWFKKSAGLQEATIRLRRDRGIEGRVLAPDGKPIAGATLAIALPNRTVRLKGRTIAESGERAPVKLSDRWRKPLAIATDADGRFRIPTETDPSALLVVVHESGYLQRPFSDLVKAGREPASATELKLQPWGKISGHIDWENRSADGERVELIVSRETLYPDMVGMSASTRSDAEGRFTFEDVPPGAAQVSRLVPKPDGSGPTQYQFPVVHPEVQAGGETDVVLGGKGPAVVGRLTGLESFEGVTLRVHPRAPHIGFAGDDEQWAGWSALAKSPLGSVVFRDNVAVEADGSFRIEGLIAESYQLMLNDRGRGLRGGTSFVLQAADQADDGVQNIGEIRVSQTKQ